MTCVCSLLANLATKNFATFAVQCTSVSIMAVSLQGLSLATCAFAAAFLYSSGYRFNRRCLKRVRLMVCKTYLRDDRSFASLSTRKVTSAIPSSQTISDVTFLGWREATTGNPSVLAGYLRIALDWDRLWIIVQSLGAVYRWFAQISQ